MAYVEGGGYVSLDYCNSMANLFMANFAILSADATLYGIIAGCNWWNPVGWAAAAMATTSAAMAAVAMSNYCSAIGAIDTGASYIRQGKSFKIYETVRGLINTYVVEPC